MKLSQTSLVVVVCLLACGAQGKHPAADHNRNSLPIPPGCYTAGYFLDLPADMRTAYAAGFMNGLFASPFLGADKGSVAALASCTQGMSDDQVAEIIATYIKNRPDTWELELNVESANAITRWCSK